MIHILQGDARTMLATLPDASVDEVLDQLARWNVPTHLAQSVAA